jgi:hypothetical protein
MRNPLAPQRSLEEMESESELADAEISLLQKREVLRRLKGEGLTLKAFGGSVRAAMKWLREHTGKGKMFGTPK